LIGVVGKFNSMQLFPRPNGQENAHVKKQDYHTAYTCWLFPSSRFRSCSK